jgi:molybdopterin-guanine dinucleotide biosynthesis protein A
MLTFSAALLAGGQSTRMGRDKALLPIVNSGRVLWQRQLDMLEKLNPDQIFWSGAPRSGLPSRVVVVPDEIENAGPLAGISACLDRLENDLLVVLAIDLPRMSPAFLRNLLAQCAGGCGAIVRHGEFFEPLAAVYPKGLLALAAEHLSQKRLALQELASEAVRRGMLKAIPLHESDAPLFKNVNSPADLEGV